jgi:ankyrin repeat protein
LVASQENTTLLRYLLLKGADPDVLDDFDLLPLDFCDSDAAVEILIDHGADISRAKLLHNATDISDDKRCIARMKLILGKGVAIDARATYPGHAEPGSRAYNSGMRRTRNEGTALHWAVRGSSAHPGVNRLSRVRWLLERRADKDIPDNTGLKPIDYASDQEMIDLLSN